jgi:hypothetical protein
MRGVLLVVVAALLLAPAAAAQPSIAGEMSSATVATSSAQADGQGVFVGFFQMPSQPDLGWSLRGDALSVDVSTYTVTAAAGVPRQSEPTHETTAWV